MMFHTPQNIREHMFFYGIYQIYHTWYKHGETTLSGPPTKRIEYYDRFLFNDVEGIIEMVQAKQDDCKKKAKIVSKITSICEKTFISRL